MSRATDKAFEEILMVAEPALHDYTPGPYRTSFLTAEEFWQREDLVNQHDAVLWKLFHSHGKYQWKVREARWFCVAVDPGPSGTEETYVSSAFVIDGYEKWLVEYVMTDPGHQGQGAASSVMSCLMQRAKNARVRWVILHTDPKKNDGQLPRFFGKFGFREWA